MGKKIQFSPPDIGEDEIEEVIRTLKSGWITTGPRTKEFENKLANYCGTSRVVCLNSATAAEELNLRICGIGPGDEVIVPAYTYTATASAVIHVGAKVVFADSALNSTEMDYEAVEDLITERTKAIIAVELGGVICNYDRLLQIVKNKADKFVPGGNTELGRKIQKSIGRVILLSDSAHALGAKRYFYNKKDMERVEKKAGAIADFTSFSFHAVKNLTTAEGGASTWKSIQGIDDEEIYKQFQLYSLHGQSKDALSKTTQGGWEYDIVGPWYKCNMTDLAAAIGLRQLERYEGMLKRRKSIVEKYNSMCNEIGVKYLKHYTEEITSSGHLYLTRIFESKNGKPINEIQRGEIINRLAEVGVSTNVHYKPLPMMTAYKNLGWKIECFPRAYNYYQNLISLPLHTKLTDEDVECVIKNYKKIVGEYI